jgi:hypothetical protein
VHRQLLSFGIAVAVSLAPCTVVGQWINQKTAGIPRAPDGTPDLNAPAPRSADSRPDLSGLWRMESKANPGTLLEKAEPQSWVVEAAKKFMHELGRDDTSVHCLPAGPRGATDVPFAKVIQTPQLITVLFEPLSYRQIHMDGRVLPSDPNPAWMGYSIGRWEGDTLVVTSTGFNDRTFLDGEGHRHTEALRMTERYTRRDFGHMDVEVTFEDPKAYGKPVTIPVDATLQPDTDLLEYVCAENERSRPHLVGTADDDRKLQVSVPPEVLARYAGVYRVTLPPPDKPMTVTVTPKDGGLLLEIENGPTFTAIPTSPTKFLAQGVGLEFLPPVDGVVKELVITIVEGDLKGTRIK